MSEKARDTHGRWRSMTIAFRISPEDNKLLNDYVYVSGLTKQDYITSKLLNRDVVVIGNPRVYKALKHYLILLTEELSRLGCMSEISDEQQEFIEHIIKITEELKGTE